MGPMQISGEIQMSNFHDDENSGEVNF